MEAFSRVSLAMQPMAARPATLTGKRAAVAMPTYPPSDRPTSNARPPSLSMAVANASVAESVVNGGGVHGERLTAPVP
ncbi:hypothetical protein GCM10022226_57860 [Sphaerisporangium flaviroseum]|uniref:Uncharacterized protein n=1 Tax=Sphaerisporangium flaviroseum TaxID=509199 RepID=A0ABP7IY73_9ACTN